MTRTATTPTRSRRPRTGIGPGKPRWKRWLSLGSAVVYLALCAAIILGLDDAIATRTVPAADVAVDLPHPGGSATCADDLLAEVGATVDCTVQDGPTTYRVRATVTTVDGDRVAYDFTPIDQDRPVG